MTTPEQQLNAAIGDAMSAQAAATSWYLAYQERETLVKTLQEVTQQLVAEKNASEGSAKRAWQAWTDLATASEARVQEVEEEREALRQELAREREAARQEVEALRAALRAAGVPEGVGMASVLVMRGGRGN